MFSNNNIRASTLIDVLCQHFVAATDISNSEEALMSAPLKPHHSNLPADEIKAIKDINDLQRECVITIKPNDKEGGQSVMDTPDYIAKMEKQLNATVTDNSGLEQKYYETSCLLEVAKYYGKIQKFLEKSAKFKKKGM